jgi:hypothetical protein
MAIATNENKTKVITSEIGIRGNAGLDGNNGAGFGSIRESKLDNPIINILAPNAPAIVGFGFFELNRVGQAHGFNKYGQLAVAEDGIPRETVKGWQIEQGGSNNFLSTDTFDTWTSAQSSVVLDAIAAPNNNTNGVNLFDTTDNDLHSLEFNQLFNANQVYTYSLFAKSSTIDQISLFAFDGTLSYSAIFNLNDGSVISASGATAKSKLYFGGWYRIEITFTPLNTNASGVIQIRTADAGQTIYVGSGTDFVSIWGPQFEQTKFATSYMLPLIPVDPDPAIEGFRNADLFKMPAFNNVPLLSDDFSVIGEFYFDGFNGGEEFLFSLPNGEDTDNLTVCSFILNGLLTFRISDGSDVANVTTNLVIDTSYFLAFIKEADSIRLFVNGSEIATQTHALILPTGVAGLLKFGGNESGTTKNMFGSIYNFRIYNFRLNNNEINFLAGA